jgi:LacI family transcriptional regulator
VPGDLAVIGVDNLSLSALSDPALTTVQVNSELIAVGAARAVLSRLGVTGDLPPVPSKPAIELIVRQST